MSLNPAQQGAQRHEYDKAKEERNLAESTFELLRDEIERISREWDLITGSSGGSQEPVNVIRPSRTTQSSGYTPARTPRSPERQRFQTEPVGGTNFTESPKSVKTELTPEIPGGLAYHRQQQLLRDRMRASTRKLYLAERELEQREQQLREKRHEIIETELAYARDSELVNAASGD
jgi:predicted  nucleic acid-binding Zn-ribbon protein